MPKLIEHPHFLQACIGLTELVTKSRKGSVGRVCGPTGSGKSEVVVRVMQTLWGSSALWREGKVPAAVVRATRSQAGRFGAKHFAGRAWLSVQDPDLGWMQAMEAGHSDSRELRQYRREQSELYKAMYRGKDEAALRDAFCEMARARHLQVLFVEDGHSMTATTLHMRPADYVQPWVSVAEELGLVVIFLGTPALMNLWDGEDEAHRRSRTVFLNRYAVGSKEEKRTFAKLIRSVAASYQWEEKYNILDDAEFIYLMSMGVFGQLLTLVERAKLRARERGSEVIGPSDLHRAAMNAAELKKMMQNALNFDVASRAVNLLEARSIHTDAKTQITAQPLDARLS